MKRDLKELIYTTLTGDATLTALLGAGDHIFQIFPKDKPDFPVVTYNILSEQPNDFGCAQYCGCGDLYNVTFSIFIDTDSTVNLDAVENRIKELFHEQYLTDGTDVETRWIFKRGDTGINYNSEALTTQTTANYDFQVASI